MELLRFRELARNWEISQFRMVDIPENIEEPEILHYRYSSMPIILQDLCHQEISKLINAKLMSSYADGGVCVPTYLWDKQRLRKIIEGIPGQICLALDWWHSNSSQAMDCVVFTGYYVDSDWNTQSQLINVMMGPFPNSNIAFSQAISVCLSDWNLEGKLFSLTVSQPLDESGTETLSALLSSKNLRCFCLPHCIAHTLRSMVKDMLVAGQETLMNIWDSIKHVNTKSESCEEKFLELKRQLQVPSENMSLDNQTPWNMTYQKLRAVSQFKEALAGLNISDMQGPSMEDLKQVEILGGNFNLLFDTADIFNTANPTAYVFFFKLFGLHSMLRRAAASLDPIISHHAKPLKEKYDKYLKDCYLVWGIVITMDPRFKMNIVESCLANIFGETATSYRKIIDERIHELFDEYAAHSHSLTTAYAEEENCGSIKTKESLGGVLLSNTGLSDFDETTSQNPRSELDQYLEESLQPEIPDNDVLNWWKINRFRYPTLSRMARHIFSIPTCAIPPDSIFHSVCNELDGTNLSSITTKNGGNTDMC